MNKISSLLITIFITNVVFAQTQNFKSAIENFQTSYNQEKYDEIFNSFSPEMKQALPIENMNKFLHDLKTQAGEIENTEFITTQGSYATYKTKFERATLAVNISLDYQNLINGLFIKPYVESNESENNNVINALYEYPEEVADIIFSKSKDFPNNTQLSIAIIQNKKANFYGFIKENDSLKPIKNQSHIFEIGSITKAFTSTVLASLVVNKKLKLGDEINPLYSFPFKDNIKLNFKTLANHTSGLPRLPENLDLSNESNPYKSYGTEEIEYYLRNQLKLETEDSKNYSYSNLGAGLLGHTLGLSQKSNISKLLQKRIFDKYKMTSSFTSSNNLEKKVVKGLNAQGEIVDNWDFDVLFGGGGILSTTEDLAKFAKAHFKSKNKELALTRKPTFHINERMQIGLGWHILKSKNEREIIWHNGGTGGYRSSMAINVEDKTAVIILSNVSAFNSKQNNIDELCFELINGLIAE